MSASDQTAAENDEKYASATISLSFDDGLPVEKSPDCTRKYSRSDLDLSDENRELRTELEKNRRRMKELEDVRNIMNCVSSLFMEALFVLR